MSTSPGSPPGPPPDRDRWSRLRPQLEALLELEGEAREEGLSARFSVPSDRVLVRELLAEADSDDIDGLSSSPIDALLDGLAGR
jgi:hypothetical protein